MFVTSGKTEPQAKAVEIIGQYRQKLSEIRTNPNLSDEGRRAAIADIYTRTKTQVEALQAGDTAGREARRTALERDLFGVRGTLTSSDAISYRDAQDRAAALDPINPRAEREALRLLTQAELSNDTHLAKAVLLAAVDNLWLDVVNAYADTHPGTEAKLQELLNIQQESSSLTHRLGAVMAYDVEKPRELASLSDRTIASGNLTGLSRS